MARRTSNDPQAIANVLRLIPAKWLVGMLVALVLYFFLQPKLNAWFGWNLPSIAAMAGNETPAKPASPKSASTKSASPKPAQPKAAQPELASTNPAQPKSAQPKTASTKPSAEPTKSPVTAKTQQQDDSKYRILKPLGRDRYESPAGLIYAPGSEEGHRLSHIARHLEDQPDRPGSHGVFDGDMAAFLVAIDDAYKRARGHAKGTKSRLEDGMTVYEAPFDQTIGYLGGTEGARKKNPKLKKLRLVLRDRNLITAFPIQ
jgi:type IV secretory pathway VirB10-like protein